VRGQHNDCSNCDYDSSGLHSCENQHLFYDVVCDGADPVDALFSGKVDKGLQLNISYLPEQRF